MALVKNGGAIFIFSRVVDFASRAASSADDKLLFLGIPVVGFPEPPSGAAASPHLIGWSKTSLDNWRATSHTSLPDSTWDFNHDALFAIPQLSAEWWAYSRLPRNCATFMSPPYRRCSRPLVIA